MAKKIFFTIMLALTLGLVGNATDINGKWKTSTEGPDGSMEITFTFKVDGAKLTGVVVSPMGDMQITNGKINGDEFSFDVDMMGNPMPHKCKVEGDIIKMKVEMGEMGGGDGAPREFILKKVE